MNNVLERTLVGLLTATLVNGCEAKDKHSQNTEPKEESTWPWKETDYSFEDVLSESTALLSLDAATVCAHLNTTTSDTGETNTLYEECVCIYNQLLVDLPAFEEATTTVDTVKTTLQVISQSGYYTGSAYSITFKDTETGSVLESNAYVIENGCSNNIKQFYSSFLCYWAAEEDNEEEEGGMHLACSMTKPSLKLYASSCTDTGEEFWMQMRTPLDEFREAAQTNEDIILLHEDFSRTLEYLVTVAKE